MTKTAADGAQRRRDNFFAGTRLDEASLSPAREAKEREAVALVLANVDAHAGQLTSAQRDIVATVAQRRVRTLPLSKLDNIATQTSLLADITNQCISAAAVQPGATPGVANVTPAYHHNHGSEAHGMPARLLGQNISSARYSGHLAREEYTQQQLRDIAEAQSAARHYGMADWFQQADLLKIGRAGVVALHEAGVKKERYTRMTGKSVGFEPKTAVEIASFAKRHNLTPEETNQLFDKISDGVEIISGGDRKIQRELDEATRRYVAGPDTPEARKALEDAYRKHADTPEKQAAAERTTKTVEEAARHDATAVQKADAKVEKASAEEAKTSAAKKTEEAALADLATPAPKQTPPDKKPPAPAKPS